MITIGHWFICCLMVHCLWRCSVCTPLNAVIHSWQKSRLPCASRTLWRSHWFWAAKMKDRCLIIVLCDVCLCLATHTTMCALLHVGRWLCKPYTRHGQTRRLCLGIRLIHDGAWLCKRRTWDIAVCHSLFLGLWVADHSATKCLCWMSTHCQ